MRKKCIAPIWAFVAAMVMGLTVASCSDDDDDDDDVITGIPVSIYEGVGSYYFMTDKDIILKPTNMDTWPGLKVMRRAYISFYLNDGVTESDVVAGETYSITLSDRSGACYEIPSYTNTIDVASDDYVAYGEDSLATLNKGISSLYVTGETCFMANGYINIYPTFEYSSTAPVYMALWYDSEAEVTEGAVTLHYFFNNSATITPYAYHGLISLAVPGELYYTFATQGLEDDDSVEVTLEAQTADGAGSLSFYVPLADFLR